MRLLNRLRLLDKIRLSFAVLIGAIAINGLVVALATYAIVMQLGHKQDVSQIFTEVDKVRLLVARYEKTLSRGAAEEVFQGLQTTEQKILAAKQGLADEALGTMLPLLEELRRKFQAYITETDQQSALKSRAIHLGQQMTAQLDATAFKQLSAVDQQAIALVQSQMVTLHWAGQSLYTALEPPTPGQTRRLHQALDELRQNSSQVQASDSFQRQLFRMLRDATDYVDSLEDYLRSQARSGATHRRLDGLSDNLQESSQSVSLSVDRSIRSHITLASSLMAAIFLLTLLSAAVLSGYLAGDILRPIRALVNVAQRIGRGELQVRASVLVDDEVGELARSFNQMTQSLVDKNQALAQAQQELEQRVQERTLALAQTNTALLGEITERELAQQSANTAHQKLAARELLLRQISDTAPVGIFLVDLTGCITEANSGMSHMFGYPISALLGMSYMSLVQPHERQASQQSMTAMVNGEILKVAKDRLFMRANGEVFWGDLTGKPFQDSAGQILGLVGVIADITERKKDEEKLQLAASVFTHAREGIIITDAASNIVEVNDTFTSITGYTRDDALGENPRMLSSDRQSPAFYVDLWRTMSEKDFWTGEIWNRRKNGEVYAQMLTLSAVRDADGKLQNYVALFSDITSIKEHEQQLEKIAHFDALTQLPNRLLLADRLQQAMLQCQRRNDFLAVAYLDLDGFKAINDTYGHDAGDEFLVALAQSMKSTLREGDTLARIGGDEFIAVLVGLAEFYDHQPLLERLLQAARSPLTVNTKIGPVQLQVSASIGVTLFPQDNADADLLMRHADQAMYVAKQSGKNHYRLFDVAQEEAQKAHQESLANIERALAQQEFELYYQPKVNLDTGRVTGAEALIRWQHPERGLLAPASFLPVIEDHPLSIAVGEWVIATALAQMRLWQDQGLALPVSVNIGAHQLQQDGFAARLGELLAACPQVSPQQLQLEVLETTLLKDLVKVSEVMAACQLLGVSFALDDFGTGYSSLTHLRHLPAQTLKIDQSFVRDMLEDASDLAIVSGVIGLAQAFNREVIAEGVETAAHGQRLLSMGCALVQGYGIARPMPAHDLADWIVRWHANSPTHALPLPA